MRLSGYIQRTRALGDLKIPPVDIDALSDLIAEGADLTKVLKKRSATLTPRVLLGIWRAQSRYAAHLDLLQGIAERRAREGKPAIAPALLKQTATRWEAAVLERVEDLCPPGETAEHRRRDGIKAAIALYGACLALARRDAVVRVRVVATEKALQDEFGDHAGTSTLQDLPPHRWLAIRRGEQAGALDVTLEVQRDALIAQVEARGAELSAIAGGRKAGPLLDAVVTVDLTEAALRLKDEESRLVAVQNACTAYLNLLATPRPAALLVAGVWVPRKGAQLAVAIVMRDGKMVASGKVHPGENPVAAVEKVIGSHPVEVVVLPTSSENPDALSALSQGFGPALPIERIKAVALTQGVEATDDIEGPPQVKMAAVLARRFVRPLKYWGQVDPVALGLAEYQQDLDEGELRAALEDIRTLAMAGVKPEDLARPTAAATTGKPAVRLPQKPLNPLVKSVDDLRPGMTVNGVVTNITQFGAFVNIGLSHEGLVHVSELADHFVNDPNEVVRVGQTVTARVLGVDRGRRRISLSLRSENAPLRRPAPGAEEGAAQKGMRLEDPGAARRKSGFGGDRPRQGATGASRAQALAELEALFKK